MVLSVRAMMMEAQENYFFSPGQNPGGPVYLRIYRLFLTSGSLFVQLNLSGDAPVFLIWIFGSRRLFYWEMTIPILFSRWDWSKSYFLRKQSGKAPCWGF
jgi:hypothetical protein